QNRQAIAEHVPDIQMTPVQHDLDAIGMAADIAVGQMANLVAHTFRWNWRILRWAPSLCCRQPRQCCQAGQGFQMFAAVHVHFSLVMRPFLSSSSKWEGS